MLQGGRQDRKETGRSGREGGEAEGMLARLPHCHAIVTTASQGHCCGCAHFSDAELGEGSIATHLPDLGAQGLGIMVGGTGEGAPCVWGATLAHGSGGAEEGAQLMEGHRCGIKRRARPAPSW